jgi:hypothetical protein
MNCMEFWKNPPGTAQPGERERHLAACAACAVQMERRRSLAGAMRALAADSRGLGAPAHLEGRLLAEFRSRNGRSNARRAPVWSMVGSWAAASAAMIVLAVLLIGGHQPQTGRRHGWNPLDPALQEAAVIEELPLGADHGAGFISLPNAATLAPYEEVNLVRVEVPRSAMMAVGLVVSEERALERVQADVMLGADGLPRAVRFLDD